MSKGRRIADDYQAGYDLAATAVENRSLREIHSALRSLLPRARGEFDWGTVDALTDAAQKRDSQNPVL